MHATDLLIVARVLWVVLGILAIRVTIIRTPGREEDYGVRFIFPWFSLVLWLVLGHFLWGGATR